ncbi:tripartite tricarboxylate transporter TctB family protein [Pseudoneobacillus sp. C159]
MDIKFDRIAAILFLTVGVLFIIGSTHLSSTSYGSSVGPNIFPLFLGIMLALLSVRLFYETFKYKRADGNHNGKLQIKPFIIIFIATFIYIVTLETLGYVITTFLFLFVCFQTMERTKMVTSLIVSACFSGAVYYVYVHILQGTLPGWPVWF